VSARSTRITARCNAADRQPDQPHSALAQASQQRSGSCSPDGISRRPVRAEQQSSTVVHAACKPFRAAGTSSRPLRSSVSRPADAGKPDKESSSDSHPDLQVNDAQGSACPEDIAGVPHAERTGHESDRSVSRRRSAGGLNRVIHDTDVAPARAANSTRTHQPAIDRRFGAGADSHEALFSRGHARVDALIDAVGARRRNASAKDITR
jgi:hypothetical protein